MVLKDEANKLDHEAKDLESEGRFVEAYRKRYDAAVMYESTGRLKEAAFSYDRAAQDSKDYVFKLLCSRKSMGLYHELIGSVKDADKYEAYANGYAAHASFKVGNITDAIRFAEKAKIWFKLSGKEPEVDAIQETFRLLVPDNEAAKPAVQLCCDAKKAEKTADYIKASKLWSEAGRFYSDLGLGKESIWCFDNAGHISSRYIVRFVESNRNVVSGEIKELAQLNIRLNVKVGRYYRERGQPKKAVNCLIYASISAKLIGDHQTAKMLSDKADELYNSQEFQLHQETPKKNVRTLNG